MKINDKLYDVLKWIAMLFLPALATLVEVVFTIWQLPYGHEIAATIIAVDAFLGGILGISTINYNKGNNVE